MSPRTLAVTLISASKSNFRWILRLPFASSPWSPKPSLFSLAAPPLVVFPVAPDPMGPIPLWTVFPIPDCGLSCVPAGLASPLRFPGALPLETLLWKHHHNQHISELCRFWELRVLLPIVLGCHGVRSKCERSVPP